MRQLLGGEDVARAIKARLIVAFANQRLAQRMPHSEVARLVREIESWFADQVAGKSVYVATYARRRSSFQD